MKTGTNFREIVARLMAAWRVELSTCRCAQKRLLSFVLHACNGGVKLRSVKCRITFKSFSFGGTLARYAHDSNPVCLRFAAGCIARLCATVDMRRCDPPLPP